ncbi:MAG: hypothetical protein M3N51_06750 [Actinomycetota bacterium]|nr:hypothetical protein [Actinomycetota bacterium]
MASITCDEQMIKVDGLAVEDAGLAELLRSQPEERWEDLVARSLAVGARGLLTMGLGIDLTEVDARVRRSVEQVTDEAQRKVEEVLGAAEQAFSERFDPERRSSLVSRALADFTAWRDGFLETFDPSYADSHTARFLSQLNDLLGPQGGLEIRLREVLDPDADGSALSRLSRNMDARMLELRDLIVGEEHRRAEALRGTAKGLDFEDQVEQHLRTIALGLGGCVVERTGRVAGDLGPHATVGDFVLVLPTGRRVVVEAKNVARIALGGKDGILAELDAALANRSAQFAICVSAQRAFPGEVGCFGIYGNKLLVVDDGEGTMISIALRLAANSVAAAGGRDSRLDTALVFERLDRLRTLAQLFSSNRRALTDVRSSVETVQGSLEAMRTELLNVVEELICEVQRGCREAG